MNREDKVMLMVMIALTGLTLYLFTYGLMTTYGLLVCGDVQERSGVNTHYNLATGCRVIEGGQDTPLNKWLGGN